MELNLEHIVEIEATLGCELPNDVLALFASGTTDLGKDAGFDLGRVLGRTKAARLRGCPEDLIALGAHPDGIDFYCVMKIVPPGEPVLVIAFDCGDRSLTARPLIEWVDARLEIRRDSLAAGDNEERALATKQATPAEIAAFQPMLVLGSAASGKPAPRRVRHPTFGEGEILSETGSGDSLKLQVQFASGTKLLLARVLEMI